MAEERQKRQVAVKARIKDLLAGKYVKEEGWMPNYIKTNNGKQISRINLIGVVVSKQIEDNYQSLVVDDGTGRISVRTFDEKDKFDNVDIGDVLLLIGRPREYGGERYLLLEVLRKIEDKKWIEVRKIELEGAKEDNSKIEDKKVEIEEVAEEEVVDNKYQKIIEKIKELDKGDGADFEEVVKDIEDGDKLIDNLLKKGEIFETRPGKLKILE
ncbi:hypothetical protein KY331_03980 [Candidatus Woesearchaeota archaeon]|nr:hypothetical protein [Candidatus Woesearchaeota archaeon]